MKWYYNTIGVHEDNGKFFFANDCQGLARVGSGTLGRRWGMSRSEMKKIADRHLPFPRVLHPWPEKRFLVTIQGGSQHVAEPPAAWWSTVSVGRRKGKKKVTPWSNAMEGLNVK